MKQYGMDILITLKISAILGYIRNAALDLKSIIQFYKELKLNKNYVKWNMQNWKIIGPSV